MLLDWAEKYEGIKGQFAKMLSKFYDGLDPLLEKCESDSERCLLIYLWQNPCCPSFEIQPQFEVITEPKTQKKRRIDFMLTDKDSGKRYAVECDSWKEHHETKAKVAATYARARELQKLGYIVVSFTGTEIFFDPAKCAADFYEVAFEVYNNGEGLTQ